MVDKNKLIGIPFKIGREDFSACDCVGICWLYYKFLYNINFPHRDGKRLKFRNPKKDLSRILTVIKTWASPVLFNELKKDDIIIVKADKEKRICALGVCINKSQVLYMNEKYGSCLIKKEYLKDIFIEGYRPNEFFV